MFDHVTIRVADREASLRFYDTVLRTLGVERSGEGPGGVAPGNQMPPGGGDMDTGLSSMSAPPGFVEWDDFSLAQATAEKPATQRLHIGFLAPSRDYVDAFWRAGVDAGYVDDGAPGPRPHYSADYYGGFLLDPDGNSTEAVSHGSLRTGGRIDHLWIRVADVAAARRFYEAVSPYTGFVLGTQLPERVHFRSSSGASFGLVKGEPTEHVHLAFSAAENGTVDAFHRAAMDAGYRDNGPPGERPEYHAGYYGAFVLDPDGNNVEVVNHNR